MNNVRLSLNLSRVKGARIVKMKAADGSVKNYVAIPAEACFIPRDKPEAHLMLTMCQTPNSQYGDFMLKPYLSQADYNALSRTEQMGLPILGKGVFMTPQESKQFANAAEAVDAEAGDLTQSITQPQATPAPSSPLPFPPSPAQRAIEDIFQAVPVSDTPIFVVYEGRNVVKECNTYDDAVQFAMQSIDTRYIIEQWKGNSLIARWVYNSSTMAFNPVKVS